MTSESPLTSKMTSKSPPIDFKTRVALVDARRDLNNAEIPGIIRWAFDPWKNILLNPTLEVASRIAPAVKIIPFADDIIAGSLNIPFNVLRFMYGVIPFHDGSTSLVNSSKNDLIHHAELAAFPLSLGDVSAPPVGSLLAALVAFITSSTVDVITAFFSPKKTGEMFMALFQFSAFLDASGVGKEMHESLTKPLFHGRLLDNMRILERIQKRIYPNRQFLAGDGTPIVELQSEIDMGTRYMRFATAAYGTQMIDSALDEVPSPECIASAKKKIAHHAKVDEEDIRYLDARPGGDMNILRHFIAVHHESRSIVLAIRGTLSVSGALIDLNAYDCQFNGGVAHEGIANMADNIWKASGSTILELFKEKGLTNYRFVITGHSLGAGTACLLNIKCHNERLLGDRPVRCYGFAPPPVYKISTNAMVTKKAVEAAMNNCICYIHGNDCVPFLSVFSVRRLSASLDAVDNVTEDMFLPTRVKMAVGIESVPETLVRSVEEAPRRIREERGGSRLIIPAKHVLWLFKTRNRDYIGTSCDPHTLSLLEIAVRLEHLEMTTDHMPECYEDALDALTSHNGLPQQ